MTNTLKISMKPNEKIYINGAVIRVDRKVVLMNPSDAAQAREMFRRSLPLLLVSFDDAEICATLKQVDRMVGEGEIYEALKAIRALYPAERRALGGNDDVPGAQRPLAIGA